MGVITYNPLAGGLLTGKYRRDAEMPSGSRLQAFQTYYVRYYTGEALTLVERFTESARKRGVSPAQLALAWVLAEQRVTCPIVGARNIEQFEDTIGGLELVVVARRAERHPRGAAGTLGRPRSRVRPRAIGVARVGFRLADHRAVRSLSLLPPLW